MLSLMKNLFTWKNFAWSTQCVLHTSIFICIADVLMIFSVVRKTHDTCLYPYILQSQGWFDLTLWLSLLRESWCWGIRIKGNENSRSGSDLLKKLVWIEPPHSASDCVCLPSFQHSGMRVRFEVIRSDPRSDQNLIGSKIMEALPL